MAGIFGHTWTSAYGDDSRGFAGREWAETLAGFSRLQIEVGLKACRAEGKEFPPSAPRFRAMCLGIPPLERVRIELTQPDIDRSPFTRSVWMHVDGYRYRHASQQDSDRMLRAAYDIAHDLVMRGHPLPEPSAALEAPKPLIPQGIPETREARIAHLQQLLGEDFNPATADPNYAPAKARKQRERDEAMAALAESRGTTNHDEDDLPWL